MTTPLAQLSRVELEFLKRAIERNQVPTPISKMALQSLGKGALFAKLGPLAGAPKDAVLALLDFALAKPTEVGASARSESSLVWSGPPVHLSPARPTTAAVLELLQSAQERVLIAGYDFDHGAVLFKALHTAMQDRGIRVSIYLDIQRVSTKKTNVDAYLALEAHKFVKKNWPFGEPLPDLYYFPDGVAAGSHKSMHAKCVVVDGEQVLIGSANFTKRGHQRNIEVGVSLTDVKLAKTIEDQFVRLLESGALAKLPAPAAPAVVVPELAEAEETDDVPEEPVEALHPLRELFEELALHEGLWKLYAAVVDRGLDAPEIGDDIEEGGDVIGSAELVWVDERVAVLLAEQAGCRRALEAAGWLCLSSEEVYGREQEIFERLERRG